MADVLRVPNVRGREMSHLVSAGLFERRYLGLVMWGGLWLRDPHLRALFPLRR